MRALLLFLAACGAGPSATWTEPLVRTTAPPPIRPSVQTPGAPEVPEIRVVAQERGPTLHYVPRPGTHRVAIAVTTRRGEDGAHPEGLVRLMVDRLADALTSALPYAQPHGSATVRGATIRLTVAPEHVHEALAALAKALRGPGPGADAIERGRAQYLADLQALPEEPRAHAWLSAIDRLGGRSGDAPHEPRMARLRSFDAPMVVRCRDERFAPEDTLVAIVGDVEPARLESLFAETFGDWIGPIPRVDAPPPSHAEPPAVLLLPSGSGRTHVLFAAPAPAPDSPERGAFDVVVELLGGTFHSRLGALRETHAYTYGALASVVDTHGRDVTAVRADFDSDEARAALEALFEQLRSLRTNPISESELALGRARVWSRWRWMLEGDSLVDVLAGTWRDGRTLEDVARQTRELSALTPAAALEAARNNFAPAASTVVISGPRRVIGELQIERSDDGFSVR